MNECFYQRSTKGKIKNDSLWWWLLSLSGLPPVDSRKPGGNDAPLASDQSGANQEARGRSCPAAWLPVGHWIPVTLQVKGRFYLTTSASIGGGVEAFKQVQVLTQMLGIGTDTSIVIGASLPEIDHTVVQRWLCCSSIQSEVTITQKCVTGQV